MKIERRYSSAGTPIADQIEWKIVHAKIVDDASGRAIVDAEVEVPASWGDDAANILAKNYLRKAGVPSTIHSPPVSPVSPESGMPLWLRPSKPSGSTFGAETSARQVFHRMAGCWTYWGWRVGMFGVDNDAARAFYDELFAMLARQVAAPNSPQFFNTGLFWAYGIEGSDSGQWYCDDDGVAQPIHNSYERSQPHACFLTPVADDLVNPGGIMDTWVREARIFKHGSGSGINPSVWRAKGEPLSGGGIASGLMSWLSIGDRSAGSVHSGGTTRRAAKMVCVDDDHPEIIDFIRWKAREEAKAAAMYVGSQMLRNYYLDIGDARRDPFIAVPHAVVERSDNGFEPEIFGVGWEEEAIRTVDGQNSNNSIRFTDAFFAALDADADWDLHARTTGKVMKSVKAHDLWNEACRAAWASADPGMIFHDTVNAWNTCAADGEIRTTNPCAEFHHLDGSACNLASLNLVAFRRVDGTIDLDAFEHACRLWTMVLDISVSMASFPAQEFAEGAWKYRTLGLGYANAGSLLMRLGMPYDSDEGRALIAGLTALMTGFSYLTSADMAAELGPFPRWEANRGSMLAVIDKHRAATHTVPMPALIGALAQEVWDQVQFASVRHGFRNAQTTLIAPTGTISFVMGCDTTGIEPELALVKHKSLAGGGSMVLVNGAVEESLRRLGMTPVEIERAQDHILKTGSIEGAISSISDYCAAVFDCSNPVRDGGRFIDPMGHVKMVAAIQPFLSGAASKTTNLPRTATVADVDRIYREAHRLGVKAVALYRDGCKLTQPLNVGKELPTRPAIDRPHTEAGLDRGDRERLPDEVSARRFKARVDDRAIYLITGEYLDGRLGEFFLEVGREGSDVRAWANCWAKAASIGFQYGVPLSEFVDAFEHVRFEPAGPVQGHARIKMCSSLADLVARIVGVAYLDRDDLAHLPDGTDAAKGAHEVVASVTSAVAFGSAGRTCPQCHNDALVRTGTASCYTCRCCGYNEGCG